MDEFNELSHYTSRMNDSPDISYTISDMPQEVLTQIFSFLSATERGNVRSTCSAWYEACNVLRILSTEKLRIHDAEVESSLSVFQTLLTCQFKYLNLEFENFQFRQSSIPFWKHSGERILSLTFCRCAFENSLMIQHILMNCPNLLSLEINDCDEGLNDAMASGLLRCGTVRESLTLLKFKNCRFLNDFIYSTMVRIFPNVRELLLEHVNINCYKRIDRRFYVNGEGPYNSEDIFSFTCVFDHLKSVASKIKSLSFHSIGDKGLTPDWLGDIAMITDFRLNYLSLEGHSLLTDESLVDLLSKLTCLTKLVIHRCARVKRFGSYTVVAGRNIELS